MKTLILIPARMASTRFPNKPMDTHTRKTHDTKSLGTSYCIKTRQKSLLLALKKLCLECITSLGGTAILTDPNLPSGTDRILCSN